MIPRRVGTPGSKINNSPQTRQTCTAFLRHTPHTTTRSELIYRSTRTLGFSDTAKPRQHRSDPHPQLSASSTCSGIGFSVGTGDLDFLKRLFAKLMLNFNWWVNRKDRFGKNVFEGGFLGLDNIGVFDRSAPLPTGGYLEQADGTAWMALFTQNMLELAMELVVHDPIYEDMVIKFVEHFLYIAAAMNKVGSDGMWDEEDGFYYDVLRLPDGSATRLKVRSLVGLLPMCATTVFEKWQRERIPRAVAHFNERLQQMPELLKSIHPTGPGTFGYADRGIIALVDTYKLRRILARMLDENEFLSPYGIRSLSRYHAEHPYVVPAPSENYPLSQHAADSHPGVFGGNSNWRGPIWMPVNALLIRSLMSFYLYYGDTF